MDTAREDCLWCDPFRLREGLCRICQVDGGQPCYHIDQAHIAQCAVSCMDFDCIQSFRCNYHGIIVKLFRCRHQAATGVLGQYHQCCAECEGVGNTALDLAPGGNCAVCHYYLHQFDRRRRARRIGSENEEIGGSTNESRKSNTTGEKSAS